MAKRTHEYRISQILMNNQGFIGLIHDGKVIATFTNWHDAKIAYRLAMKA